MNEPPPNAPEPEERQPEAPEPESPAPVPEAPAPEAPTSAGPNPEEFGRTIQPAFPAELAAGLPKPAVTQLEGAGVSDASTPLAATTPAPPAEAPPAEAPPVDAPPVDAPPTDAAPVAAGPAFELPTARQVVGRGLQLALDASRDIRRASIYIGLLLLAVLAPFLVLLIVDLPSIADAVGRLETNQATSGDVAALGAVIGPLYATGLLAVVGAFAVSIDGGLVAVAILGARAIGRPIGLRAAVQRARQVFWRYLGAAVLVGILSLITTLVLGAIEGGEVSGSIGGSLLETLVAAIVTAPFGYILTGIVIGDVGAMTAMRRSLTLSRARPWLMLVVAAFAFLADAIEVFGLSAALEVVDDVAGAVNASVDPTSAGSGLLFVLIGAIGIIAYGSLVVTVGAISVAPQVAAFLGLTHFTAGLQPVGATPPRTRWVTIPMLVLIALTVVAAVAGISSATGSG